MREVRIEYLSAPEVREQMFVSNLLYIPIGPLEWHGPHLPYGTDPLNAYALACRAAQLFGGLVHPLVYAGAEVLRQPNVVAAFGLPADIPVVGMDIPGLCLKSFYTAPEEFRTVVEITVNAALRVGFKKIVLINGHGADEQKRVLKELATEMGGEQAEVIYFMSFDTGDEEALKNIGHADRIETEVTMANYPDLIHIECLPRDGGLKCKDYAIVDSETFDCNPTPDFTTRSDPRLADVVGGVQMLDRVLARLAEVIGANMVEKGEVNG